MSLRTDLAYEAFSAAADTEGADIKEYTLGNFSINEIDIKTDEAAKRIGKPIGKYITINTGSLSGGAVEAEGAADAIAGLLSPLLPDFQNALVVGLGNAEMTVDALGPLCVRGILATRHIEKAFAENIGLPHLKSVSAIAPGVLGQTGIEAQETIKAICDKVNPEVVIIVDALAAAEYGRLGNTVQINNFGIAPGSGVGNRRKELSRDTLKREVIAIGVPTVAAAQNEALIITSRECDLLTKRAAELLSHAINFSLQPKTERDILLSLV